MLSRSSTEHASGQHPSPGAFDALKRIAATLLDMTQTRFEMAGIELIEEKNRLLSQLLTGLAALLCMSFGVLLLSLMTVVYYWDTHRLGILGVLALLYGVAGAFLWFRFQYCTSQAKPPFSATFEEMSRDRQALLNALSRPSHEKI